MPETHSALDPRSTQGAPGGEPSAPEEAAPGEGGRGTAGAVAVSGPLSIGEVLTVLSEEFPDVTISKIRFLESQGLVQPERNASGYRQFGDADIERLRWILRQQRDHFLPLKVIRRALERGVDVIDAGAGDQPTLWTAVAEAAAQEEIGNERERVARNEAADARRSAARSTTHPSTRGDQPPAPAAARAGSESSGTERRRRHSSPADVVAALQEDPRPAVALDPAPVTPEVPEPAGDDEPGASVAQAEVVPEVAVTPAVQADATGIGVTPPGGHMRQIGRDELLAEAGLSEDLLDELADFALVEPDEVAGEPVYDEIDLAVARLAGRTAELGISPRHLRMYKVAAVREAGLLEQVAMPLLKQRNPAAKARAAETVADLSSVGAELHRLLLARELGPHLAP